MKLSGVRFSTWEFFSLVTIAAVFLAAFMYPSQMVVIACRLFIFCVGAICIVIACTPTAANRWEALAALLSALIWKQLLEEPSDWQVVLFALMNASDSAGFKRFYIDIYQITILQLATLIIVGGGVAFLTRIFHSQAELERK